MKLFLLISLMGFCIGSFATENSPLKKIEEASSSIHYKVVTQQQKQSLFATVTPEFTHIKRYKNIPHYRQHNFAKDLYNTQSLKKSVTNPDDKLFVAHRYSYCKTIGQLLIFPQHYFW